MRVESGIMPQSYRVKVVGDKAFVEFAENVTGPFPTEDGEKYEYDAYILEVKNSPNLEQRIFEGYDKWLAKAKEMETLPKPKSVEERVGTVEVTTGQVIDVLAQSLGVVLE